MLVNQYNILKNISEDSNRISHDEVVSRCFNGEKPDVACTLLYGYTTERSTFHVYIHPNDENIHIIVYEYGGNIVYSESLPAICVSSLHPNKRVYPSKTLFTFGALLQEKGEHPCYTSFHEDEADTLTENNPDVFGDMLPEH